MACSAFTLKGLKCKKPSLINEVLCHLHLKSPNRERALPKIPRGENAKRKTKEKEERQIRDIVNAINEDTNAGKLIKDEFFKKFGKQLLGASNVGGRRKDHFDFDILVDGEGWKHVEHKGSFKATPIKDDQPPWRGGVQFYNGPGKQFSLVKLYAQKFYEKMIMSGEVSQTYGITSHIPSFDVWQKAAFHQGKGDICAFVRELREKCVTGRDPNVQGLHRERDEFTRLFNEQLSDHDKETLKNEVTLIANSALSCKDYWLQFHGDIGNKFFLKWSPKFVIDVIERVEVVDSIDCTYRLVCRDNFALIAKVRWGYNKGISNLRMDLK